MLSFENELSQLRATLGDRVTDRLIARERREVFSIYPELRMAGWAGAMLVATAAERTTFGRNAIYDVTVCRGDDVIAEFRGRSRQLSGTILEEQA